MAVDNHDTGYVIMIYIKLRDFSELYISLWLYLGVHVTNFTLSLAIAIV